MHMTPNAIDLIIHHLLQHNYLNETRFAQAFSRGKFRTKKWGKIRIIRELKLRNISKYNIDLALKEIPEEEYYSTFHELAQKRFDQLMLDLPTTEMGKTVQNKRKKLADYLLYRGWESGLVWEKVRELISY
jgi:regulatory protein